MAHPQTKEDTSVERGLLGRCITGSFRSSEPSILTDVRTWASSSWKKVFGVNIYEMARHIFLFEFPNRAQVKLEWWSPPIGCAPAQQKISSTWIRAIGLPLHLWFKEIFQEIENKCGGWKSTEEETEPKNHLKLARIEVQGEVRNIPNEVSISKKGTSSKFLFWLRGKI